MIRQEDKDEKRKGGITNIQSNHWGKCVCQGLMGFLIINYFVKKVFLGDPIDDPWWSIILPLSLSTCVVDHTSHSFRYKVVLCQHNLSRDYAFSILFFN